MMSFFNRRTLASIRVPNHIKYLQKFRKKCMFAAHLIIAWHIIVLHNISIISKNVGDSFCDSSIHYGDSGP